MKLVHILKSESKFVLILVVFLSYVVYNNWPANLAARQENKATNCYEVYDSFDDSFDQDVTKENEQNKQRKQVRKTKPLLKKSDNEASATSDGKRIQTPFLFVGGYPRSGTTLMRAILDVHPQVSCGPETRILPLFLDLIQSSFTSRKIVRDLNDRLIDNSTLDMATSLFVEHIVVKRLSRKVTRPCSKDPKTLMHMGYLNQLFPNAQFVYMVRDARSAVYSLMNKEYKSAKGDFLKFENASGISESLLLDWNSVNTHMYGECQKLGASICHMIKYEELVNTPERTLRALVKFLGLEWHKDLLRHEQFVGERIKTSELEWSTNEIRKQIGSQSLNLWLGKIEYDQEFVSNLTMQRFFAYTKQSIFN